MRVAAIYDIHGNLPALEAVLTIGTIRVVNAGSVGMPYREPGAYWLLLGTTIQLRRTSYDRAQAAARILATDYPQAEEFAAENVAHLPSEAEALGVLTRMQETTNELDRG